MLNYPIVFFVVSILLLWLSAWLGSFMRGRVPLNEDEHEDFGFVQAAVLTLLGLIIGFSFSMATGRYDQRRNYEEEEANAIGTEYVRVGLFPAPDAARMRVELARYLELRISFYSTRDPAGLQRINTETAVEQTELWSSVQAASLVQPNAVVALAVEGMNDVLNTQGYTQAAWWNRIPRAAWGLMIAIAVCCNVLVGYGSRTVRARTLLLPVLPLVVSIAFFLIADIDSPRGGLIHVPPQNLLSLQESLPKN